MSLREKPCSLGFSPVLLSVTRIVMRPSFLHSLERNIISVGTVAIAEALKHNKTLAKVK